MDPEGVVTAVVRAGLVCLAHDSTYKTLSATAVAPAAFPHAARTAR